MTSGGSSQTTRMSPVDPYEMIEDVNFGGGLVTKKSKTRMQLVFRAPLPAGEGSSSL